MLVFKQSQLMTSVLKPSLPITLLQLLRSQVSQWRQYWRRVNDDLIWGLLANDVTIKDSFCMDKVKCSVLMTPSLKFVYQWQLFWNVLYQWRHHFSLFDWWHNHLNYFYQCHHHALNETLFNSSTTNRMINANDIITLISQILLFLPVRSIEKQSMPMMSSL